MLERLLSHLAGRFRGAGPHYRQAVPALVAAGRHADAERLLTRRLQRFPADADARHYLGLVCLAGGRHDDAVSHLTTAVALAPSALFHSNLGEAHRARGHGVEAEQHARRALELEPANPDYLLRLANLLAGRSRVSEALEYAQLACESRPDSLETVLFVAGCQAYLAPARAAVWYEKALAIEPDHPAAVIGLYRARRWLCDWSAGDAALREVLERWAARPEDAAFAGTNPFVAFELEVPPDIRDRVTQAHADWLVRNARASGVAVPESVPLSPRVPQDGRRLRIGYLSSDFHGHPTMHLMRRFFAHHDRERFDVRAYSLGPDDAGPFRRELMTQVDGFRDLEHASPAAVAAAIRADGIDILVDLKGFTHGGRPDVLAMQPAPLRVAWLGYPASTGHGLNDYMVADRVVAPAAEAPHYGERLVWMPHTYQVTDDEQPMGDVPSRASLGLPEHAFVFACFNHVYKIDAAVFGAWMRILQRVPGSVLWLYSEDPEAHANLRAEASRRGVDDARLLFAGTVAKPAHLARLAAADLYLDTLHVNAHTGASDALWAGLPLITCPQSGFASRVAASVVCAAGLGHLVCDTLQTYEERAVSFGHDRAALQRCRDQLKLRRALPLFDTRRFTRNLERAYEMMWQRHCAGLPPEAFEVPDCGPSGR